MKRLLFILVACIFGPVLYGNQITVIGDTGKLDIASWPLKVNKFEIGPKEELDGEKILRICEALDNSRFLYFPNQPSINASYQLFKTPAVHLKRP